MAKPNPYCPHCRGTGHKQMPDHSRLTTELVMTECNCVQEQRAFESVVLDIFLILILLSVAKFIFS